MTAGGLSVVQDSLAGQLWTGPKAMGDWDTKDHAAMHASLASELGSGLMAKRNAAAAAAERFKGSDPSACMKILSSSLSSPCVKSIVVAAAGLPKGVVMDVVGLGRVATVMELLAWEVKTRM